MKNKYTDITLIENPVRCVLFKSEKKFRKELKRLGIKERPRFISRGSDATVHFFYCGGEQIAMICMKKGKRAQRIALLTHEVVHIWREIKLELGEHSPSGEFECYAIQGILYQLLVLNPWVLKDDG